ncbi:hypothetical protein [Microbacterium sp. che218]|uniref:hypothetical protein n=1 Tax=Microbacterium sp. che218 TaxID=3140649 RepID=UPI003369A943
MSIASLLSHHGIHTPRYVTVDGRIVFDGVHISDAGIAVHDRLGPVTSVQTHTFHGGVDAGQIDTPNPWWEDSEQVMRHRDSIHRSFPGFGYSAGNATHGPRWTGQIDTGRGRFTLQVELRADQRLPALRVIGPKLGAFSSGRWVPSPHLYLSGNLCVADRSEWNPVVHDAATAVAWGAHWLAAYTEWRMSRRWPIDGVQVDGA